MVLVVVVAAVQQGVVLVREHGPEVGQVALEEHALRERLLAARTLVRQSYASAGTAAAACSTAKVLTFDSLDANSSWAAAKSGKRAMLLGGVNLETTPETRSIIRMGRS